MPELGLKFVIEAENRASAELQRLPEDVNRIHQSVSVAGSAVETTGKQLGETTRIARLMSAQLVGELNPAMGTLVIVAGEAGRAFRTFSFAASGVGVAVAVMIASLTAYARQVLETAQRHTDLNFAVKSLDVGALRGKLEEAARELALFQQRAQTWVGSATNALRVLTDALGFTEAATAKLREAQDALSVTLPVERERALTEIYGRQLGALIQLREVEAGRLQAIADLPGWLQEQQKIAQAYSEQFTAEEKLLQLQGQIALARAQTQQGPTEESDRIQAELNAKLTTLGTTAAATFAGIDERKRAAIMERFKLDLRNAVEATGGMEQILVGPTPEDLVRGTKLRQQAEVEALGFARDRTQVLRDQLGALIQLREVEAGRLQAIADLPGWLQEQQKIAQAYSEQFTAEEKLLQLQGQIALARAQTQQGPTEESDRIQAELNAKLTTLGTTAAATFAGIDERKRAAIMERFKLDLRNAVEATGGMEQILVGPTPEDLVRGTKLRQQAEVEALGLARDRTQVLRDQYGLTEQQRESFDVILIQQERLVKLAEAGADERKRENVEFEASVRVASRLREEFERTDILGGMARGLREVSDELTSFGRTGADTIRGFAQTAERTLSDLFFLPVQQGWKKTFEELPRQFALSAYRILTDTFARLSIGTLLRNFGLAGAVGGIGMPGASVLGFGMPGASVPGVLNVTGYSPAQLAQLQQAGYQIATAGGQSFAMPSLPFGSMAQSMFGGTSWIGAALNTPLSSIGQLGFGPAVSWAQLGAMGMTPAEMAALGATGPEIAAASAGFEGAGLTLGTAAGWAGAGIGAAFALYSAYQSGSPAYGAMQGAMSGLMVGMMAGGPYGAAIGLVVGALLGAGAGALGKGNKGKLSHAAREKAEAGRALGAAQAMVNQVLAAKDLDEIMEILTFYNTGYVGGKSSIAVMTNVVVEGVIAMIGDPAFDGKPYRVATREELIEYVETLHVSIQAGVNQGLLAEANRQAEAAIKQKIKQVVGDEAGFLFGYEETFGAGGMPGGEGVTRATLLPISRAAAAKGRQLFILQELLDGMDDATLARFLERLAIVDWDHDLRIIRRDEYGSVVSTRVRHRTPPPPPPPPENGDQPPFSWPPPPGWQEPPPFPSL